MSSRQTRASAMPAVPPASRCTPICRANLKQSASLVTAFAPGDEQMLTGVFFLASGILVRLEWGVVAVVGSE